MKRALTLLLCFALLLGALSVFAGASSEQTTDTTAQAGQTALPISASFLFVNAAMGYGSGTLSMQMPTPSNATSFALYWGDASGAPLPGYTPFLTGAITTPNVSVSTSEAPSIPTGAQTILVYTYSEQFGESPAPYKIEIGT